MLNEGEFDGYQAILLRPAKAFPFLKLPREVQVRTYGFYFAAQGVVGKEIVLEGKRTTTTKEVFAKSYADGSKDRVALLAVDREIYKEAVQVLYGHTIKLESTTVLLDFMGQLQGSARARITDLSIKMFVKTTSRNALHFLAEAAQIKRLHIDSGICNEGDPIKAAKAFFTDAYKFLEAAGAAKGDKAAGVDVLSFGKQAFKYKDDSGTLKPWANGLVDEFKDNLRAKLK